MPRPINLEGLSHVVVRTRTGDQLHLAHVSQPLVRNDGSIIPIRMWHRTGCGCRVALAIGSDVTVRPGLLCEKCFTPGQIAAFADGRATLNVKLI